MGDVLDAVKCRKCRFKLFETNKLVDSHGNSLLPSKIPKDVCKDARLQDTASTVLYVLEDSSVWNEWLITQIDNSEWIKGKLFCPKCNFRLGSFDFVGGSLCGCGKMPLPPVHITKSKVDYHVQEELDEIVDMIRNRPPNPDFNYPILTSEIPTSSSTMARSGTPIESSVIPASKGSAEETIITPELEGLYNKDRTFVKRKDKSKKKAKHEESSESESVSLLRTILTCPVCLDILFSPFTCKPCGHTFCETCLRRIALPRPTQTACPLCRQLIYSCEIHKEYIKLLRANFPSENNARACHEERALLQTSPLPWVPLYQFRNPEHERSFLETALIIPRNFINSFWLTIPTIGLLFLLHSVGFVTFFLSYFGFSYIGTLWINWIIPLWKILFFTGSKNTFRESTDSDKNSIYHSVFALIFAFIVTVFVWKKIRRSVTW